MSSFESNDGKRAFSSTIPSIPDHQALRCIGRGSYGEVWLARNMFGIYRAVKVIYRQAFEDERPFERELTGIQRFEPISRSHEGFVDVLQIGRNDEAGYFYYVMELADDLRRGQDIDPETYAPKTLGRDVLQGASLPIEECVQLGLSLSNALEHLHRQKLVHRDIKPSNIIFVNGVPKLADIGLVAEIRAPHSYVGTEGFFPPEGPGSPQADIFSLGKVLYEISTGEDRHAFPRLPANSEALAANPQFLELNEIILRACQNDARQRYQTAEEMYADLTFLLSGKSVKRLRLLERRLVRLKKGSAAAAIALLALGLGYYQVERERKHRTEIRAREMGGQTAYGVQALEQGQLMQALPSFIEAMSLDSRQKEAMHRVRIGTILDQCPKLLQMWSNPDLIREGQFSRDGRFLVLASETHRLQVMDVETGQALGPAFGPTFYVRTARFNADGTSVLVANLEPVARLWDWRTGQPTGLRLPHTNTVNAANFNHAGSQIVTAGDDGIARVWDATNGTPLLTLEAQHTRPLIYAAFSPDDKLIVTTSKDNSALIWDARNGKARSGKLLDKSWVTHASFSPDGLLVATGCFDGSARVWDVVKGQQVLPTLKHRDEVSSVEFSPDGRLILTGCWDGTARIWEAATGQPFKPNPVLKHTSRVMHASFHPDGHRILTTCLDGTSRLWDLAASSTTNPVIHAVFSGDGTKSLVKSNGCLRARDTKSNKLFAPIDLPSPPSEAAWSRNDRFLLTVCRAAEASKTTGGELAIWESETGQRLFFLPVFTHTLEQVALSDDGQRLVSFWMNKAQVYDLSTSRVLGPPLAHPEDIRKASFSPNGEDLLTIGQKDACVWNLHTRQLRFHPLRHFIDLSSAQFSHDGRLIATCCLDDQLTECSAQIWDAASGKPLGRPLKHRDGIFSAAFSPNNDRVVTASEDFTALIWDLVKRGEPKKLQHDHQVHEACFSPGGSWVLTVSRDHTARLWDAESGEPLSPPLPHPSDLRHGVFLDDYSFVTADQDGQAWVWQVRSDSRPVQDLMLMADILNGKRPSVNTSARLQETAYTMWRKMKAKYPEDFATTQEELAAWHRQQAAVAKEEGQWRASLFHYNHLLALQPGEPSVLLLREEALREMEAQEAASPR